MRQLRKVAVTQHSLPYQHLFSYYPATRTKKRIVPLQNRSEMTPVMSHCRYAEIRLQITDRAHTDINQVDPGRYQTG